MVLFQGWERGGVPFLAQRWDRQPELSSIALTSRSAQTTVTSVCRDATRGRCAAATTRFEKAEALLEQLQNCPVEQQLGAQIVSKNMKLAELVAKWDTDNDKSVSKKEFREHVAELGVVGTREEVDALFDTYDDDGGGSLDLEELKPTLNKLIETAKATAATIKEVNKSLAAVRKEARTRQKGVVAMHVKEAAEAKAKAEAEMRAKVEAEAAAAEAKRMMAEARAAAEARKKAEKEEYEARIAARRAENKRMVTEDARVLARREAQKSVNDSTGEFDAKREWKVAGLMAKAALIGMVSGVNDDDTTNGASTQS